MSDESHIPPGSGPPDSGGDDDLLAAEYVLGVVDDAQRAALAARMAREPDFARRVADWETRLSGLNSEYAEIPPPDRVKMALDRRLFPDSQSAPSGLRAIWRSLAVWRTVSALAVAGLAALALLLVYPETPPTGETLVVGLDGDDGDTRFVALYDRAANELRVTRMAGDKPAGRDFELWLIYADEAPVSLGLVGGKGDNAPHVPESLQRKFVEGAIVAVSLEPPGGSPTGSATGPVVALGPVKKI